MLGGEAVNEPADPHIEILPRKVFVVLGGDPHRSELVDTGIKLFDDILKRRVYDKLFTEA